MRTVAILFLLASTVTPFKPNSLLSPKIQSGFTALAPTTATIPKNVHQHSLFTSSDSREIDQLKPIEIQEQTYLELASTADSSNQELVYIIMYLPGTAEEGTIYAVTLAIVVCSMCTAYT